MGQDAFDIIDHRIFFEIRVKVKAQKLLMGNSEDDRVKGVEGWELRVQS